MTNPRLRRAGAHSDMAFVFPPARRLDMSQIGGAIAYLPLRHRLLASTPSREIEIDGTPG